MSYYCCPKCGSMITHRTGGAACLNSMCDWVEFPLEVSPLMTYTTEAMKVDTLAHRLLYDLVRHHSQVLHTMQIPNNCTTCALIEEARKLLK